MIDDLIFAYFAIEMLIKMVRRKHQIVQASLISTRLPWECSGKAAILLRAGISLIASLC